MSRLFCFHKWGEWSKLVSAYSGIRQFRSCKKCNKAGWRAVCLGIDSNLTEWDGENESTTQADKG